jgi:hypothetical protein
MFKGLEYDIACIDFDGTMVENNFPLVGLPNMALIDKLKEFVASGGKWILWTCRNGIELETAVEFCKEQGITPDAINDDVPGIKSLEFGRLKSKKPYCDIYVDDKNQSISDFISSEFPDNSGDFELGSEGNDRISGVMGFIGK